MTAIESKEEISDTDSGIILHSGKNITSVWFQHMSCITHNTMCNRGYLRNKMENKISLQIYLPYHIKNRSDSNSL